MNTGFCSPVQDQVNEKNSHRYCSPWTPDFVTLYRIRKIIAGLKTRKRTVVGVVSTECDTVYAGKITLVAFRRIKRTPVGVVSNENNIVYMVLAVKVNSTDIENDYTQHTKCIQH
jgi:hypothetical protein